MFADYHVHTEFSDDSVYPMESVVRDAIQMGMDEICFTDHVDYGVKDDWDAGVEIRWRGNEPFSNVDYPAYMAEIRRMQSEYGGRIHIRTGLEFGMQTHTIPQYKALFARYLFDFIILSIRLKIRNSGLRIFSGAEARKNIMNAITRNCLIWSEITKTTVCWAIWI